MAYSDTIAVSKVELSISCSKLKNLDVLSKSDPMCIVYIKRGGGWQKITRTEMIKDNLNPKFAKTIMLDYFFEEVQHLKFVVYDVDNERHIEDLSRHDLIGEAEFTIADVISAGQVLSKTLRKPGERESRGKVHVQGEEIEDNKFDLFMQYSGSNLDKKDFFGKSDPYFEVAKAQEGGSFTVVHRSEVLKKTLSPKWKGFNISAQKLCSGDWDRTLEITVYDWNSSGDPDLIGKCTVSLKEICKERGGSIRNLPLINDHIKAKKKDKYHNSGILNFDSVKATPTFSFVDYIRGGCAVNLVVAVDFTGSNGKPSDPKSLHYMSPVSENEYVYAIRSVGSVLAPYDTDQQFPCFGFGAKVPPHYQVSHCFALSGDERNPQVVGVDGILGAYQYSLSQIQLYGPTNFSSFLDRVIQMASVPVSEQNQSYYILLIITDGIITDMKNTVDRIVHASSLPLSIVIVGVGGADFSNMEVLDADDQPLVDSRGKRMARDIVQFVPMRDFKSQRGANFSLAKETLAEIPGQLLSFMKSRNIKPHPPVLRRQETVAQLPPQGYNPSQQQPAGVGPPGYLSCQPPPTNPSAPGYAPYQTQPAPVNYPGNPGQGPYPSTAAPPQYPTNPPGPAPYPTNPGPAPYPTNPGPAPYPTNPASAPYSTGSNPPPYPQN